MRKKEKIKMKRNLIENIKKKREEEKWTKKKKRNL